MNNKLFAKLVDIANLRHDGHVTIMKFTTGWKVVFGTPELDHHSSDYHKLTEMPSWETADQAIVAAIAVERASLGPKKGK